jgi:hypothetical protein
MTRAGSCFALAQQEVSFGNQQLAIGNSQGF